MWHDTRQLLGRAIPLGRFGLTEDGALLCAACMSSSEARDATTLYQLRQSYGSEVRQWAVVAVADTPAPLSDERQCAHCERRFDGDDEPVL